MTATRNTILALGLMFATLAAGRANAQHAGGFDQAGFDQAGYAQAGYSQAGEAPCNATGDASGGATCQGGACGQGCTGFGGFRPEDFCHDPNCRYAADNPNCVEPDPILGRFSPEWQDLCERCGGCTWRVNASALYLYRSNPSSVPLLVDPTSGNSLLNASDAQFPYRAGPRLSFILTDCAGWGVELNYFGVDGWSYTRDFSNADFPSAVADLVVDSVITEPLTNAHADFTSMLHSSEINLRKNWFGGIDALIGFRWIDMYDRYFVSGTSAVTGNTLSESVETRNHLFGCQTGLDGCLGSADSTFRLNVFIKGGGMLNNAVATSSLSDPGNLGSLSLVDSEVHVAFFGEAGVSGYVQLDKHVGVSIGYQVMYVSNVAQPGGQIAQTDLTGGTGLINVGDGVFYHGANLGLEMNW